MELLILVNKFIKIIDYLLLSNNHLFEIIPIVLNS